MLLSWNQEKNSTFGETVWVNAGRIWHKHDKCCCWGGASQVINAGFKVIHLTVLTYKFLRCGSLAFGDAVCESINKCHLV